MHFGVQSPTMIAAERLTKAGVGSTLCMKGNFIFQLNYSTPISRVYNNTVTAGGDCTGLIEGKVDRFNPCTIRTFIQSHLIERVTSLVIELR